MADSVQGFLPMDLDEGRSGNSASPSRLPPRGRLHGTPVGEIQQDLLSDGDTAARSKGAVAGEVRRILHANPSTGFYVLRVRLDGMPDLVTFVGPSEPVSEGDRVEATGTWERHARYGRQLRARFIRVMAPNTGEEICAFLRNGGVKGIGKRSAEKLFEQFGERLPEVMTSETALMAAGLTERQAGALAEAWSRRSTHTEVIAFLQALSIGPVTIEKIMKRYGEKTRQVITSEPFRIAREIPGIGFRAADQMAIALGIDRRDARRVDAAILHAVGQIGRDGHCACSEQRILSDVRKLLTIEDRDIRDGIARLKAKRDLIEEEIGSGRVIYDAGVLRCEEELAEEIAGRAGHVDLPGDVDEAIRSAAAAVGLASLHENQVLAVHTSLAARLSVITGGPGSGKTSSVEVMLRVFESIYPGARIELAAPTGRAAQRLSESTGRPARTIHRLLEWSPEAGGFQRNEDRPLEVDIVLADEASMLDIWLARDLLRAIPREARLVLVGDVDQLPSVGPGQVLGDVIDSGIVPVTRLTRVFRQGEGSRIALAAQEINAGRMPHIGPANRNTDLWAAWNADPEDSLPRITRLVAEVAPDLGHDPFRDVQVLCAGHNGVLGTASVNRALQERLNPADAAKPEITISDRLFRVGDRVIQTANNYDLDVFNGDIGRIVQIGSAGRAQGGLIRVAFDGREIDYSSSEARQLSLAYAITVHKSQGSEFPVVVFAPSMQHYTMLRKPLIYTAVTRARKLCVLIGQERAARQAVRHTGRGRMTGLARRLLLAGTAGREN